MSYFSSIAKEIAAYEKRREQVIPAGREVLREAKRIVFLCHEQKLDEAGDFLTQLTKKVLTLEKVLTKPLQGSTKPFALYSEGSWNAGVEEYLEAWFTVHVLAKGKIVEPPKLGVSADVAAGALSDCTGELVRVAIMKGAKKDLKMVERFRSITANIVAELTPLYLTGQARQKFDAAKRNLKRIEEIIYDVSIRQ